MKCDNSLKNRIKRAQGQMQGVLSMMENDKACMDILTQLKAIRSSIDKSIGLLTTQNLIETIEHDLQIKLMNIDDAVDLIIKGK
jgi:CsoR family transcriptional regulator, copper-sensing transcriptional repressor